MIMPSPFDVIEEQNDELFHWNSFIVLQKHLI